MNEDPPETMLFLRLRLPDRSAGAAPADQRVPLSSHPCLALPNGMSTGPGPSLPVRFAAHRSPVLRPDPPPWCLCPPLPTHGYRQASPRRGFFAGHRGLLQFPHHPSLHVAADTPPVRDCRIGLVSVSPCCFRTLSTVSATGIACNEATSAFTARYNLERCASSFRACCRRAPPSCFRATAPPQLRGLSLLASVGLSPTG